jgi:GTP cyclohydrolase I
VEVELAGPQDPGTPLNHIVDKLFFKNAEQGERSWFAHWLGQEHPELVVEALLWAVGDNALRDGLQNTPRRVVASWRELFAGYGRTASDVFTKGSDKAFDCEQYDQMIILRHVPFTSMCEHHMLPFTGQAHVAYIPGDDQSYGLLGVSKLARLVELHARRLQNQERITKNTVDDLMKISLAKGAGVQLVASHSCMACRGVLKPGSEMVTTALRGVFTQDGVKAEFFAAIQR